MRDPSTPSPLIVLLVERLDCDCRVRASYGGLHGRIDDRPLMEDAPEVLNGGMSELSKWSLEHLVDKGYVVW